MSISVVQIFAFVGLFTGVHEQLPQNLWLPQQKKLFEIFWILQENYARKQQVTQRLYNPTWHLRFFSSNFNHRSQRRFCIWGLQVFSNLIVDNDSINCPFCASLSCTWFLCHNRADNNHVITTKISFWHLPHERSSNQIRNWKGKPRNIFA